MMGQGSIPCERKIRACARAMWMRSVLLIVLAGLPAAATAQQDLTKSAGELVLSSDMTLEEIERAIKHFRSLRGLPQFQYVERRDYHEVRKSIDPVIVLTTVYNMSAYELYPPFHKGSVEATEVYNSVIRRVAEEHDALLADIWDAEGQAPWLIAVDTVHANRLGHRVIAHCVFQKVVTNCSGAAQAAKPTSSDTRGDLEGRHQSAVDRVIKRLEAMKDEKAK